MNKNKVIKEILEFDKYITGFDRMTKEHRLEIYSGHSEVDLQYLLDDRKKNYFLLKFCRDAFEKFEDIQLYREDSKIVVYSHSKQDILDAFEELEESQVFEKDGYIEIEYKA